MRELAIPWVALFETSILAEIQTQDLQATTRNWLFEVEEAQHFFAYWTLRGT